MTSQMKLFLKEFADLLEKHDVEFDIDEDREGFTDIEICMPPQNDKITGKSTRDLSYVRLPSDFSYKEIRKFFLAN